MANKRVLTTFTLGTFRRNRNYGAFVRVLVVFKGIPVQYKRAT